MSRLEGYRAEFWDIRHGAGYVVKEIAELWPLVWRTTADRCSEQSDKNAFDLGRRGALSPAIDPATPLRTRDP